MTTQLRLSRRANEIFPILGFVAALASLAMPLNAWLVAVVLMGAVIAAVHHAEVIAHRVGEPFGTLILALAVTVIEVGLILTLMQAEPEKAQTLARDTVFAAVMVIVNLLLGLCLLLGAIRHHEQRFQRTGMGAALATLTVLTVVTLVLPNFTSSAPGSYYTPVQLGFVAVVSLILYGTFALVQTVRHRDYFLPDSDADADGDGVPDAHAEPPTIQRTAISGALLLASLVAVVLLAKNLSPVMGMLLAEWGAPPAVLGVLIAALILAPEGLAAVRAAKADRLQTSLNLARVGAGDDRPHHPCGRSAVDRHRPADQPGPRRQVDGAAVPVFDRRVTNAGERTDDGASGGHPPDAVRDLPVHDLRTVERPYITFVMLNLFQHPWPTLSFSAALKARSGHGP